MLLCANSKRGSCHATNINPQPMVEFLGIDDRLCLTCETCRKYRRERAKKLRRVKISLCCEICPPIHIGSNESYYDLHIAGTAKSGKGIRIYCLKCGYIFAHIVN